MTVRPRHLSVGRLGAGEDDPPYADLSRSLQYVSRPHHVHVVSAMGILLGLYGEDGCEVDRDLGTKLAKGPLQVFQ